MNTVICPKCKEEREVTYQQKWNIAVDKSSGKCPCCEEGIDNPERRGDDCSFGRIEL